MDTALDILIHKIREGKKIRIIGDYDIDGICSTYILLIGLRRAGACVDVDIPDRMKDGYGISKELIDLALAANTDTIVTCDNGISALEQIAYAKSLGMTVVVTDHHEIPYEEQEDGRYKAVLTDEQAHAWAEIYFDGEGWLPVETTPAAGTQSAGMDGENGDYMPDTEAAAGASGAENGTGREDESNQGNQDVPDQAEYGEEPGKEESATRQKTVRKMGMTDRRSSREAVQMRTVNIMCRSVFASFLSGWHLYLPLRQGLFLYGL